MRQHSRSVSRREARALYFDRPSLSRLFDRETRMPIHSQARWKYAGFFGGPGIARHPAQEGPAHGRRTPTQPNFATSSASSRSRKRRSRDGGVHHRSCPGAHRCAEPLAGAGRFCQALSGRRQTEARARSRHCTEQRVSPQVPSTHRNGYAHSTVSPQGVPSARSRRPKARSPPGNGRSPPGKRSLARSARRRCRRRRRRAPPCAPGRSPRRRRPTAGIRWSPVPCQLWPSSRRGTQLSPSQ